MSIHREKLIINVRKSKFIISILECLFIEGYINGFNVKDKSIQVYLKFKEGKHVVKDIKLVSKPTRRVYKNFLELKLASKKNNIYIISTNRGIESNRNYIFKENGEGGEVILLIV